MPGHEKVNPELIRIFRKYQQDHPGRPGGAYTSPDNFSEDLQHPELDQLKQFIMDGIYEIALELNRKYWEQFKVQSIDVNVTGMWFQISNNYAFHETHVHGNCSWSGVYYVQAGSSSRNAKDKLPNGMPNGVTRFYGPDMEHGAAGHGDIGNYYLQDSSWTSYPEDGRLMVFPSHLKHMVFPYNGEEDRIIVSFHAQINSESELRYNYSFH